MTSGRSGKDNLWRDLAATVVQQVADRVRDANETARSYRDAQRRAADGQVGDPPDSAGVSLGGSMAALGGELKKLVSEGVRATAGQAGGIRQSLDRAVAERERKRLEAPMRKAQGLSRANKAGAITMGVFALGALGATASLAVDNDAPAAIPTGVATVGLGAGAAVLNRRGNHYQQVADSEARRLGAASAAAVSLRGASAYSVPLPPQSSLAYDPTRRLMAQKKALAELLPEIEQLAPELAPLARESESTLAAYADRIIKLERAQAAANGAPSLDAALARAVAQYEEGVDAHQKLVEAAATVMAELSSGGIGEPTHRSMDAAADRLQGLAEGLRQVRYDIPIGDAEPRWAPQQPGPAAAQQPAPRPARKPNRRRGLAD